MRIVSWNCRRGFEDKAAWLTELNPDIAIIPECREPRPRSHAGGANQWVWTGRAGDVGVGAWAYGEYSFETVEVSGLPTFVMPLRVVGPAVFNLVAVWTVGKGFAGYVRVLDEALTKLADFLASGPTVIAGDFNSNAIWDRQAGAVNHTSVVRRLGELGLVSAYHQLTGEAHGAEATPTFHQYFHRDKPHHIDYVFVPHQWSGRVESVTVGDADTWLSRSDHAPLVVDL